MKKWLMYVSMCVLAPLIVACFPTTDDVNRMQDANQTFNAALHDAGNTLMTEQHATMLPEVAEALTFLNQQNVAVNAELKKVAGLVTAQGADVSGLMGGGIWEILGMWFPGLAGIGLWLQNLLKPSRAASQVSALESSAKATADELAALKLQLATAADAKEPVPVGGTA